MVKVSKHLHSKNHNLYLMIYSVLGVRFNTCMYLSAIYLFSIIILKKKKTSQDLAYTLKTRQNCHYSVHKMLSMKLECEICYS